MSFIETCMKRRKHLETLRIHLRENSPSIRLSVVSKEKEIFYSPYSGDRLRINRHGS